MSSDPLRDPNFPDRPQSPEFWRISEIVLELDAGDKSMTEVIGSEMPSFEDVAYPASNRCHHIATLFDINPSLQVKAGLMAAWMEGFIVGKRFSERQA